MIYSVNLHDLYYNVIILYDSENLIIEIFFVNNFSLHLISLLQSLNDNALEWICEENKIIEANSHSWPLNLLKDFPTKIKLNFHSNSY